MNGLTDSAKKMPVAIQAVLGLALVAYGAWTMLNATFWSDGDLRFLLLFLSVGVLYLLNGVPTMVEGFMTMFYKKESAEKKDG